MLSSLLSLSCFTLLISAGQVLAETSSANSTDSSKRCKHPEVRVEWRSLSAHQRKEWMSAVKCLSKLPHESWLAPTAYPIPGIPAFTTNSSLYDDIVYVHMDLNVGIHSTGFFLPWHRWYVWSFTSALKSKCGYKGVSPYWDWSKDVADFVHSDIWDTNKESGIGGWGDPSRDYAVPTGAFRDFTLAYPSVHTLRRNFTMYPWANFPIPGVDPDMKMNATFSPSQVSDVINGNTGDFVKFQYSMEKLQGMHGSIHVGMGGDHGGTCPVNAPADCTPGPTWSVNDPIFFLHHGNIDRIWWLWQTRSNHNLYAFKGGSVANLTNLDNYPNGEPPYLDVTTPMPTDGWSTEVTIQDMLNSESGNPLCYVYA